MARAFSGQSQWVNINNALASLVFVNNTGVFTFSIWARLSSPDDNAAYVLFGNNAGASGNRGICLFWDNRSAVPRTRQIVSIHGFFSPQNNSSSGQNAISDALWHNIILTSNNSEISCFIDGTSVFSTTTSVASTGNPAFPYQIGTAGNNVLPWKGDLAEFGLWNVALTAQERASLVAGFAPRVVRPASLQLYVPLVREVQDTRGGFAVTNSSTTASNHPRVY